jgi:hypothetical protein
MSHFGPIPRYETNIRRATFESDCLENLYASQLLAILVLTCSKAAVVLLVLSLKPFEKIKYACNVALGAIGVWALASLIGLGVQCKQPEPWHFSSERCAHQHALYIGLAIVHIILDMAVIVLPVTLLWTVRMIQWRRYQISALFAIRLMCVILGFRHSKT